MFKGRCGFFLVLALASASTVKCGPITFSGAGTSGTMNPNSLSWQFNPNDSSFGMRGVPVWGSPGLLLGQDTWPTGDGQALSFTIIFTSLPVGVTIDQTPDPTPASIDDFTRFESSLDTVIWTPSYAGGNSVMFTPPGSYSIPTGAQFFVNVAFTGDAASLGAMSTVQFTGDWTTTSTVPEPDSVSLLILGLSGAGLLLRRRILA